MKRTIQITYYDLAELNYASFFLAGLYRLADQGVLTLTVSNRRPEVLENMPDAEQWRPILFSVLLFRFACGDEAFYFCIDTRDSNKAVDNGRGYHLPLLDRVKVYFKVNYNAHEIERDSQLARHAYKIIAVPLFFPTRLPTIMPYIPFLLFQVGTGLRRLVHRVRQLKSLSDLDDLRALRNRPKVRDLLFLVHFYAPHERENEFRYQIMSDLRARPHIRCHMGFVGRDLPGKYREFQIDRHLPLDTYLSELAASRIALYVRGMHDCHSFKLGQLLAMGMPIVGQPILNNQAMLMANPHFDIQFAYEHPREIVNRIEVLLEQPEELQRLGVSNAAVFDHCYTPEKIMGELLTILSGRMT